MPQPRLASNPQTRFQFEGFIAPTIQAVTQNWLLSAPVSNPAILEMFSDRDLLPYRDQMPWAGEFAGKYLTAAVQVFRVNHDPQLYQSITEFVQHLLARQDSDGYLGPWPKDARLKNFSSHHGKEGYPTWDTWGHYHIIIGLILWHEVSGDQQAVDAACRIADLICRMYLGRLNQLVQTGSSEMNLAPVHALAKLYRITGEANYLAMAEQIVAEFGFQENGQYLAGNYLAEALSGKDFYQFPRPRWESLHPIMGLAELYWATDNSDDRLAFERIWRSIQRTDRHNNGGFSSGEQATGNPFDPHTIETCCTIAWMALSVEMLKLTADSHIADELELSLFNSVLGMHSPSGRWSSFTTPMDGIRCASAHQIVFQARPGSPELNCCSVNSPRGLGLLSEWAILTGTDGIYLNFYGSGISKTTLEDGTDVSIEMKTDYPLSGKVRIDVQHNAPNNLRLFLRIPAWSNNTTVEVNGGALAGSEAGTYLPLQLNALVHHQIELQIDMTPRFWQGERECQGLTSVYHGPILLAFDPRYNREYLQKATAGNQLVHQIKTFGADPLQIFTRELALPALDFSHFQLTSVAWEDWLPPRLLFEAPIQAGGCIRLCDFSSAGVTGTLYRTWLP